MRRVLASLVAALLAVFSASAALAATESTPEPITVTMVDAFTEAVELVVTGAPAETAVEDVTVTDSDGELAVTGAVRSQTTDRVTEVVFVVDTNARAENGAFVEQVKSVLPSIVADLSPATSVGIVGAGSSAVLATDLTADSAEINAAIDSLSPRNESSLLNGLDRAVSLFSSDDGSAIRSVIVVTTGRDTASEVTATEVQAALVQRGVQVYTVDLAGGDPRFNGVVERTGGRTIAVDSDSFADGLASAVDLAADRLLVTFSGTAEPGERPNITLTVDGSSTKFSYPAGSRINNKLQLAAVPEPGEQGLSFFRTSIGLYLAVALAFVGIALGVWAVGSIMSSSDSSLEGMLSRYAEGELDLSENDDVEELIVQSAILQRAVSFSESFAEKRGFLARVEDLLERANLPVRAGEAMFMLTAIGFLTAGLMLVLTRSVIVAMLLGIGASFLAVFIVRFMGRRRFKSFESQLPDTLQLLSGTLRAGYSLPQGFEVVSKEIADPMGQELRRAMTESRLGRELEESLSGVSERMQSADFAWAVMAIGIQREVGGNLNELLMSVADTMIARERLKREISALTAEGRMSAGVLSFLPPGLGVVMWVMNPEYINVLFSEFLGNVFLGLGLVSALVGLAWMKKVITVDV